MQIDIQALNFPLTNAIKAHIDRQIGFGLNKCNRQIQRIIIRLTDINGPRGGEDMCCHIQVVMPKIKNIIIVDTEVNLYQAINCAINRVSRSINRQLSKNRSS